MTPHSNPLSSRWLCGAISIALGLHAFGQEAAKEATVPAEAAEAPALKLTPAEVKTNSSYALGHRAGADFAQQFGQYGVNMGDLETESFLKGFTDSFAGNGFSIEEEALGAAMEAFGEMIQTRELETAEKNQAAGQEFLKENAKRDGVVTTESGLQYEVLKKGGDQVYVAPKEGEAPVEKLFKVHYRGTLLDGSEFDASPEGEPITMTLQVVPGFREALTTMPVGAKWKLFLSPDLAYGERRASAKIGPNSTLIFELELEGIEDAPPQQGMPFQLPGQ